MLRNSELSARSCISLLSFNVIPGYRYDRVTTETLFCLLPVVLILIVKYRPKLEEFNLFNKEDLENASYS